METKKIQVLFDNILDKSNSQVTPLIYNIGVYNVPVEVADHLIERDVANLVLENKKVSVKYKKKISKKLN